MEQKKRQMKMQDFAKLFCVGEKELKQKDIIDLLKAVGVEKKSGASLEGEELDYVLTVLTFGR